MKILGVLFLAIVPFATMAGNPVSLEQEPSCVFGEETFRGGLAGYCEEIKPQRFELTYRAFDGTEVHKLNWPDGQVRVPVTDCVELCQAGALFLAHETDLLVVGKSTASGRRQVASGGGCDLTADASESYETGDLCGDGEPVRCHGACGLGCVGCEEKVDEGFCPPLCESVTLHCYTRPCCSAHDDCLSLATTPAEELACHRQAIQDGCGLDDADGTTNNEPDADCMDVQFCRGGFEVEPIESELVQPIRQ